MSKACGKYNDSHDPILSVVAWFCLLDGHPDDVYVNTKCENNRPRSKWVKKWLYDLRRSSNSASFVVHHDQINNRCQNFNPNQVNWRPWLFGFSPTLNNIFIQNFKLWALRLASWYGLDPLIWRWLLMLMRRTWNTCQIKKNLCWTFQGLTVGVTFFNHFNWTFLYSSLYDKEWFI